MQRITGKRGASYKVVYDTPSVGMGERRQRSKTFRTRREADNFLTSVRHALANNTYVETPKITFRELADQYLDTIAARVKPATRGYYRTYVTNLTPLIGDALIAQIDPPLVQRTINELAKSRAASTVMFHASFMKSIFARAVEWRLLGRSPYVGIMLPKDAHGDEPPEQRIAAWTAAEAARFLVDASWHPRFLIFRIALMTGLRRSEILALRWQDIDLRRGTIRVRATLSRTEDGHYLVSTPKTHGSNRLVHLDRDTADLLAIHRKQDAVPLVAVSDLDVVRSVVASDRDERYVFTSDGVHFVHPDLVSASFAKLVKRLDVPTISFHGLRHTHTSILFETGQSLRVIMERLGHTSATMALERYAHGSPEADKRAADAIARAVRDDGVTKSADEEQEGRQAKEHAG